MIGLSMSSSAYVGLYAPTNVCDVFVVEDLDRLHRVADDEAVEGHHHRQQHVGMLGDAHRLDHVVVGFLGVLARRSGSSRRRGRPSSRSGRSGC